MKSIAIASIVAEGLASTVLAANDPSPKLQEKAMVLSNAFRPLTKIKQAAIAEPKTLAKEEQEKSSVDPVSTKELRNKAPSETGVSHNASGLDLGVIAPNKIKKRLSSPLDDNKRRTSDSYNTTDTDDFFDDNFFDDNLNYEGVEDLLVDIFTRPLATYASYTCNLLAAVPGPPACTACEVTEVYDEAGVMTGAYNLDMNCPNMPAYYAESSDTAELFATLDYYCGLGLCENCNLDPDNFVIDLESCSITALLEDIYATYYGGNATSDTGMETFPSIDSEDIEELIGVVEDIVEDIFEEPEAEPEVVEPESTEAMSAVATTSPKSTIFAMVMAGLSWCWITA
jgi:hypothetical protein